jgi:formylglycine-generating enzyme required for sulfatase activity
MMVPPEIDLDEASLLTQILIMEIANSGRYSVQPRDVAVQTIMTEQRIKHSAVAEPVNVKSIGRALNVQQVLSSGIRFFDQDKLFIASILNTADASQRAGSAAAYQSVTGGIELMRELVSRLGSISPVIMSAQPAGEDAAMFPGEDLDPFAGEDLDPFAGEDLTILSGEDSGVMVLVTGGSFRMGGSYHDMEGPPREVAVSSFYMGRNEVTQEEWEELMGDNPSYFKGARLPVENISWYDAIAYCNKRSEKEGLTPAYQGSGDSIVCDFSASGYRLPTEAEWEYAARWGNSVDLSLVYIGEPNVNSISWFTMNSGQKTQPVMTKVPNTLGLYDMSGNVYEWCWDWYDRYGNDSPQDPTGPASGEFRVIRGGSWLSAGTSLRHTGRSGENPSARNSYIGLRVVRR